MEVDKFLRRRTVIYGEAGSGKTRLLAHLLSRLKAVLNPLDITVVDIAPEKVGEVGGPLTMYADMSGIRYLRPARKTSEDTWPRTSRKHVNVCRHMLQTRPPSSPSTM
ncbi:MAG: hypothetical protein QXY50_05385 [Candidatus Caldarchaeum sp.]